MKKCNICNLEKPLTEFYENKGGKDGYQKRCKECTKKKSKEREEKIRSTPEGVESEKARHRDKYHRLSYKDKHKPSLEEKREIMQKYKAKYPEKKFAKDASQYLPRQNDENERHHWSYNEEHWKDIIELSVKDHNLLHRNMIYDQNEKMYRNSQGILLNSKQSHIDLLASLQ